MDTTQQMNAAPISSGSFLNELLETIRRENPAVCNLANPKDIHTPPGFMNPKLIVPSVWAAAEAVQLMDSPARDLTIHAGHVAFNEMIRCQVPTFFVSSDLCDAMMHTTPPEDMMIEELRFPGSGLLFVLPIEFTMRFVNREVPFLVVAKVPPYYVCKSPIRVGGRPIKELISTADDGKTANDRDVIIVYSCVTEPDGTPVNYATHSPTGHQLREILNVDIKYYTKFTTKPDNVDEDKEISNKLTALGLNLLLAMTIRPDLITREMVLNPTKKKDGKVVRRAVWRPNFLGENYRVKREGPQGGTHASPKVHYRLGHVRSQRHGPGNTLRKDIWIEPVWVNLKSE